jgi:hypothetical protein
MLWEISYILNTLLQYLKRNLVGQELQATMGTRSSTSIPQSNHVETSDLIQ